jgi:hypothetical protein
MLITNLGCNDAVTKCMQKGAQYKEAKEAWLSVSGREKTT